MTDTDELSERLRDLRDACGANKHDQVTILIQALLDEDIDTRNRIIGALKRLDFTAGHVARMLDEGLRARRWSLTSGRYLPI
jgi:hypothetical protein